MKIKLFIAVFILIFSNACSDAPVAFKGTLIADDNRLGSSKYVAKKTGMAARSGSRNALTAIMNDVDKNRAQIDNNDPHNILRLYRLVSSLVYRTGYVDKEVHYFRNKLNRTPESLNKLMSLNSSLPMNKRWVLLDVMNSTYHIQGADGEYNLKFLSAEGFCEAVYNKYGILLDQKNDPVNMGTFNYAAGIKEANAHEKYDVIPYLKWGNTLDSPEKDRTSINKGVHTALLNYKAHSASVFKYRKILFGMQQGRVSKVFRNSQLSTRSF